MGSQTLSDCAHSGIGYDGDLLDVLVMISHEAEVGRHGAETFPFGKRRGLDHDACDTSRLLNMRVDRFREPSKVASLETIPDLRMQDGVRRVECVVDHLRPSCIAQAKRTHAL